MRSRIKVVRKYQLDGCFGGLLDGRREVSGLHGLSLKYLKARGRAGESRRISPKLRWRAEHPRSSARNRPSRCSGRVGALACGAFSEFCAQATKVLSTWLVVSLARAEHARKFCAHVTHVWRVERPPNFAGASWPSRCFWRVRAPAHAASSEFCSGSTTLSAVEVV